MAILPSFSEELRGDDHLSYAYHHFSNLPSSGGVGGGHPLLRFSICKEVADLLRVRAFSSLSSLSRETLSLTREGRVGQHLRPSGEAEEGVATLLRIRPFSSLSIMF